MSDKWFSSGRGIFSRTGGFQIATMPITVNWQEDAEMIVGLLNKGEDYEQVACERDEARNDKDELLKLPAICMARAQLAEMRLATAIEALEWYAETGLGDAEKDAGHRAYEALDAIRAPEKKP